MNDVKLVSKYWGEARLPGVKFWMAHPIVRREVNRRISGDPNMDLLQFLRKEWFPDPIGKSVSLACGFGALERNLVKANLVQHVTGLDISEGAVDAARKSAVSAGFDARISYEVVDLNALALQPSSLDAVWMFSAAHHVFNLENLFMNTALSLRPGGIIIINDYIGPSRFQSSPKIVDIINDILKILPKNYRRNLFENQTPPFIDSWAPPSMRWFEKVDPSEAVRSSEIMPIMERYFQVELYRPYGGAILHFLLSGIAGNFDDRPEAESLIRLLIMMERQLEDAGVIQSDFAVVIARPKC